MSNQPIESKQASRKPTIDQDVQESPLHEITAETLVEALNADGLGARALGLLPEKKKVELWLEPENLGAVKVKDIIRVLRNEKKKTELETDPWGWRATPATFYEQARAGGGLAGYPAPDDDSDPPWWTELRKQALDDRYARVSMAQLVDAIADRVVQKIKSTR